MQACKQQPLGDTKHIKQQKRVLLEGEVARLVVLVQWCKPGLHMYTCVTNAQTPDIPIVTCFRKLPIV